MPIIERASEVLRYPRKVRSRATRRKLVTPKLVLNSNTGISRESDTVPETKLLLTSLDEFIFKLRLGNFKYFQSIDELVKRDDGKYQVIVCKKVLLGGNLPITISGNLYGKGLWYILQDTWRRVVCVEYYEIHT